MVKPRTWWEIEEDKGIELTKMRIKHMETHGMGKNAMEEKARLQKQQRHKELRKNK